MRHCARCRLDLFDEPGGDGFFSDTSWDEPWCYLDGEHKNREGLRHIPYDVLYEALTDVHEWLLIHNSPEALNGYANDLVTALNARRAFQLSNLPEIAPQPDEEN